MPKNAARELDHALQTEAVAQQLDVRNPSTTTTID